MRRLPFLVSLTEKGDLRLVCNQLILQDQVVFLFFMRGLITANLKSFETYPNDNDEYSEDSEEDLGLLEAHLLVTKMV